MKVSELIEKLQEMDQDAPVKCWVEDAAGGAYYEVISVEQHEIALDHLGESVYEVVIE